MCQLDGALSRAIGRIYDGLMDMAARFYAVVDYPDEDIEDVQREQMLDTLRTSQQELETLLATFSRGQLLKLGVPTVILGRPNAGKSSCSTPCWATTGPSSPTLPAPHGTPWRKRCWWAACCCG